MLLDFIVIVMSIVAWQSAATAAIDRVLSNKSQVAHTNNGLLLLLLLLASNATSFIFRQAGGRSFRSGRRGVYNDDVDLSTELAAVHRAAAGRACSLTPTHSCAL